MFEGVNVALGVTGSIVAVKVVELAHELRRWGAPARAVTTGAAIGVAHPWMVEFTTDDDVATEIIGCVEHVGLCGRDGWADVSLVAPVATNTVGKIAAAINNSPVTTTATTALGAGVPVVVAPAMHESMYDHPGVLGTIERVRSWGVEFVDPRIEEGKTKTVTEEAIVTGAARATTDQTLARTSVVVTASAVTESIDPIRMLSNRASGRTGRAIVRALAARGADVTLVYGGGDAYYADVLAVESAAEMLDAVEAVVDADADTLASTAAILDFAVEAVDQKIRFGEACTLDLEPAPKLIDTVRESYPDLPIAGSKAETTGDDEVMAGEARCIMDRVDLAFVVANDASVTGGPETHALVVRAGETSEYVGLKGGLGTRIAAELATELEK